MGHPAFILEWLLHQLKWRAERENALNRVGRRDFHIIISCVSDFATMWQTAESFRHLPEGFVGLREFFRDRIDKGDADRHVRENFLVENHFALNAAGGFGLAAIKNSAEPREDSGQHHQPSGEHRHAADEVMHRFVSDIFGLFHHDGPSGRFHRTERVKAAAALEISFCRFADFLGQDRFGQWRRIGIGAKIICEQGVSHLVEDLAG